MAFIVGTDTRDVNSIGNGSPVGNLEVQAFYTMDSDITGHYNPYAQTSTWIRIKGAELKATEKVNQTPYYDQFDEVGVKSGRAESTFELSQDFYGTTESITQLKNKQLWYAEGVQDDRNLLDNNNTPIFQEITYYKAKLIDVATDKGDLWKVNASGKYDTAAKFTVIKGITPTEVTLSGNATASTGVAYTLTVTAKDFYGDAVDISDLTDADLAGEITSIQVTKTSGTPTMAVANGSGDNVKQLTFTGTGAVGVKVVISTKNGKSFESAVKTITVS